MGTPKIDYTIRLGELKLIKKCKSPRIKTLINSLTPNLMLRNSKNEYYLAKQAII
jgi:hypothetical protein